MSDCLLRAYAAYLIFLGTRMTKDEAIFFHEFKRTTHARINMPTHGSVVPALVQSLANDRKLRVVTEHRIYTPEHYYLIADNEAQRAFAQYSDFGKLVEDITLEPAIYCDIFTRHAFFSEALPKERQGIVMALQLRP